MAKGKDYPKDQIQREARKREALRRQAAITKKKALRAANSQKA